MSFSPPLQHVRELPEFAYLMSLDRSKWPRCLLWHGWLLGLSGIGQRDPWATSFGDLASFHLERCLGVYPVDFVGAWTPPELVALSLLVLVSIYLLQNFLLRAWIGENSRRVR